MEHSVYKLKLTFTLLTILYMFSVGREEDEEDHGWMDGVAILCAVILVVMVSAINDWQKERQFRSLQNKIDLDHTFAVLRGGGELVELPVSELVVGDICLVKYGTNNLRSRLDLDTAEFLDPETGLQALRTLRFFFYQLIPRMSLYNGETSVVCPSVCRLCL